MGRLFLYGSVDETSQGLEVILVKGGSVKNKFFTHEFVPAASNSQVTERYGYFYGNVGT